MEIDQQAIKRWETVTRKKMAGTPGRPEKFFQVPYVTKYLNKKICGEPVSGSSSGIRKAIAQKAAGRKIERAISVGCGAGQKEMELLSSGLVDHFTLVDIVPLRRERSLEIAEKRGLSDRIDFRVGNAFEIIKDSDYYDLVYWDTALHHMPDTGLAIEWSRDRLQKGGIFAMQEYVGPSRFQFTPEMLKVANDFRRILPDRYFEKNDDRGLQSRKVSRRSVKKMLKLDPSEATDSINIIPSLMNQFDDCDPILLGGTIYRIGLEGVYQNIDFDSEEGQMLLELAFLVDDQASKRGLNLRAAMVHEVK